jgi:hypothetical protein
MAFRKATIVEQFDAAIAGTLEPGEQVRAGTLTQAGPTPWLTGAIGIVLMLVLGMRYYFVAVTDRRVIFFGASLMTVKPTKLGWADPIGAGTTSTSTPTPRSGATSSTSVPATPRRRGSTSTECGATSCTRCSRR